MTVSAITAKNMLGRWTRCLGAMLIIAFALPAAALCQSSPAPVNLGSAAALVSLAKTGISSTAGTSITGDIGVSPVAATYITGFGLIMNSSGTFSTSSLVTGKIYAADYVAPTPTNLTTAVGDMETAYTDAAGRTLPDSTELGAGDITGMTLAHGLYKWSTGLLISAGGVTLSGSSSDVWILQIAGNLNLANTAAVTLSGGAQASNIFWQVAGQITVGTTAAMKGIMLCQTAIVMGTGATLDGRAFAQTAITFDDNAISSSSRVAVTQEYSLQNDWNMVSVPLVVNDFAKTTLYPSAVSNAYAYTGSYVVSATLANGTGYWVQYNGVQNVTFTGMQLVRDTVSLQAGWNMIGSLTEPIAVSSLVTIPGGMIASQFFGYNGSYVIADTLRPGQAYWVQVNQGGMLVLSSSAQLRALEKIRIIPISELPPSPPGKVSTQTGLPNHFALEQNYPNPFNPTTNIRYALPVNAHVILKVYNMLGQEMMELVNEVQDAGYKSVSFDANRFPSGVYVYRISAGTFSDEKKLMLVK